MPSGNSSTGLETPNTAGSSSVGDHMTGTLIFLKGRSSCAGTDFIRALQTQHHDRNQNPTPTKKPDSHINSRTAGTGFGRGTADAGGVDTGTTDIESKGM